MGTMQFRLALAVVASAALFLTGCPDQQQGKDNQGGGNEEAKPAVQPVQAPAANAEEVPPKVKKIDHPPPVAQQQPARKETAPPLPLARWTFAEGEKTWGLKMKSVSYEQSTRDYYYYKLLVEFARDLTPEELKAIHETFPQHNTNKAVVYYYDKDSVVIGRAASCRVQTTMTGLKGDAFRIEVGGTPDPTDKNAVRAAIRLVK